MLPDGLFHCKVRADGERYRCLALPEKRPFARDCGEAAVGAERLETQIFGNVFDLSRRVDGRKTRER